MSGMLGNPFAEAVGANCIGVTPDTKATLALAFEVRTVALLLAAGAGGNGVHDEDGLVEAAMRRLGMGESDGA